MSDKTNHLPVVKKEIIDSNILIVDDNQINNKVLSILLGDCGYKNIQITLTGHQALKYISCKIDLIFIDIHLPDIDGFSLCKKIRDMEKTLNANYKIIAITSETQFLESDFHQSGFDDFLIKPYPSDKLCSIISFWLS